MSDPKERFAALLYEAAISSGLEGRFDWSEVRPTYLSFVDHIIRLLIPLPTPTEPPVRSPDALRERLPHHP